MKVKKISCFILSALSGVIVSVQAQTPMSLYFMETVPQISQMNPAYQPRANGYLSLPSIGFDFRSDFAVKDMLQQQGDRWYTPIEKQFDYALLRKSIGKKAAMLNSNVDVDIIGFGFRTGNGYLSFGISEHVVVNTALPSDLFKITESGFPDETSLDFSPLRIQAVAYKQFRIGYSTKINDKLSIGVNVKPLFGQVAIATDIRKFTLHTGEYQWDVYAQGDIYSSAPYEVTTDSEGKIDDTELREDLETNEDWIRQYGTGFNNPGIAVDLGATYRINERFVVSAALNNLGFISWKDDLNGVAFNGNYTFNGVEYDVTDDRDDLFDDLLDSLENAINYHVQHDKFNTKLAPVFYAGANYQLTKAVSAGLLSRTTFWRKGVRQNFNLSLYLQPYSFVALNVGANYQVKGNVYLGGGFTFFFGPLQFYFLTDYVPVRYSTIRIDDGNEIGDEIPYIPERQKTVTFRTGLNLIFGRHGYVNKPMLDRGTSSWN
ncbi:MAG: DUF5723 family protein [Bacteroidales bacterium]|jgi:hypothetical protein|nr:DUF5723 family protein [Bacteroidales bacterium]